MITSLPVHQMMAVFLFGTSENLPMEVRSPDGKFVILGRIWDMGKPGNAKAMFMWTIEMGNVGEG